MSSMPLSLFADALYHQLDISWLIVYSVMQVRLYSLAGHLHDMESASSEQPTVVQRLPSKLSSLAWEQTQQVIT